MNFSSQRHRKLWIDFNISRLLICLNVTALPPLPHVLDYCNILIPIVRILLAMFISTKIHEVLFIFLTVSTRIT